MSVTREYLLTSRTDPLNRTTKYSYDANSRNLLSMQTENAAVSFEYSAANRLTSILHNGFRYGMQYDTFGNLSGIRIGNRLLVSYAYGSGNGYLSAMSYGNGDAYGYTYDAYGRVTAISVNGTEKYTVTYDAKGNTAAATDAYTGRSQEYTYDQSGNVIRIQQPGYSDIRMYTQSDLQSQTVYTFGGQSKAFTLKQDTDGLHSTATLISGLTAQKTYDTLNRETIYAIGASLKRQLTYENVSGNRTTTLPASVVYTGNGNTLLNVSYTYDAVGNIATMVQDGVTYTYTYDTLNQLTAVTTSDSSYTAAFRYDNGGNLTSKTVNGQTYTYTYGDTEWKDLLTSYNGETITYDAIGNPLSYRGKTLTWTGRRLDSLTQNGSTNTYLYNADGIRTQKTVNGTATEYFLNGSTILAEKTGDTVIWFIYDDSDVLGLIHNGTAYYYLKNQQGDVLKIVDGSGNVVGSYTYDAWGKVLSATGDIAQANPIRYRSYYYDADTGLYYLQSRYYDPEIGRFISADDTQYLGASGTALGYNLFGYCENNPVNAADPSGSVVQILVGAAFSAVTTWLLYLLEYKLGMRRWSWPTLISLVLLNAAMGAITSGLIGGPFYKLTKLAGLAQKAGVHGVALKAISYIVKGTKTFINMIIKPMSRYPGESWFSAVRRLLG